MGTYCSTVNCTWTFKRMDDILFGICNMVEIARGKINDVEEKRLDAETEIIPLRGKFLYYGAQRLNILSPDGKFSYFRANLENIFKAIHPDHWSIYFHDDISILVLFILWQDITGKKRYLICNPHQINITKEMKDIANSYKRIYIKNF